MTDTNKDESKWDVQLRKGTLELAILAALKGRRLYGLELLNLLKTFETMVLSEGTLYPLLDRLKRDSLVMAKWEQEGDSRPRKYFSLTHAGEEKLLSLSKRWRQSVEDISFLLANSKT
jgi:PadR family transcriptional regulator PadR